MAQSIKTADTYYDRGSQKSKRQAVVNNLYSTYIEENEVRPVFIYLFISAAQVRLGKELCVVMYMCTHTSLVALSVVLVGPERLFKMQGQHEAIHVPRTFGHGRTVKESKTFFVVD